MPCSIVAVVKWHEFEVWGFPGFSVAWDKSIRVLIHASLQSSVASLLLRLKIRLNLIENKCSEILCSPPLSSPLLIVMYADICNNLQWSNYLDQTGISLDTTARSL